MRGGALPPALICAALGLALAFAPRRRALLSIALLVLCAVAASFLRFAAAAQDAVFLGCWSAVVVCALAVHLPRAWIARMAPLLALYAGCWTGAVIAAAGVRADLLKALPLSLLSVPGAWLVGRGAGVAIKVAASWLIAIAILAAALPLTPTPGYKPDHMD